MIRRQLSALLISALAVAAPSAGAKIRVAAVGASITYGVGVENREKESYTARMQGMLGSGYEVRNFGVSGATMLKTGDRPYWSAKAYHDALKFEPNIVVIDLGGNDSKPRNWAHKDSFADDAQ